ncbi:MAG: GntR family transcriptional regulator, partial [Planctomycetota bacterium]
MSRRDMVEALRSRVETGEFTREFPLPSERVLGDRFGAHRTTVRRALQQLTEEGVLRREGRRIMVTAEPKGWLSETAALIVPPPNEFHDADTWRRWSQYITLNLSRAIDESGLNALTLNAGQLTSETLTKLAQQRPMGMLIPEVFGLNTKAVRELCDTVRDHGLRLVVGGGDPRFQPFDRVASDHEHGGYILTKAMIEAGCRKLACVWAPPLERYWLKDRRRGAERACAEMGVEPPVLWRIPHTVPLTTRESFDEYVRLVAGSLLSEAGPALEIDGTGVDGVMLTSDRGTFATAAALRLFGKQPGADVLIGGYDNVYGLCEEAQFEPSVPHLTVDKHNAQM